MIISCEVNAPVLLNCWKHHAGFIKYKISEFRRSDKFDFQDFRRYLLRIGESLMDLYLGNLMPFEIADSIVSSFKKKNVLERGNFITWLKKEGSDFRVIELKDKSLWTLRLSEQKNKYIHVHPSRYSPHTIRVRALTLKSAILYLILKQFDSGISDDLQFLNRVRREYLGQPPLKTISSRSTFPELIGILNS